MTIGDIVWIQIYVLWTYSVYRIIKFCINKREEYHKKYSELTWEDREAEEDMYGCLSFIVTIYSIAWLSYTIIYIIAIYRFILQTEIFNRIWDFKIL